MTGRNNKERFPDWFVEGTAQLAGGGFPTNWNNWLKNDTSSLTSETDTSQDKKIAADLKKYSVDGRPYGHGYLAAAYAGYLANGGGAVTAAGIAAGMDRIFDDLLNGKSFASAIKDNTGGAADLKRLNRSRIAQNICPAGCQSACRNDRTCTVAGGIGVVGQSPHEVH